MWELEDNDVYGGTFVGVADRVPGETHLLQADWETASQGFCCPVCEPDPPGVTTNRNRCRLTIKQLSAGIYDVEVCLSILIATFRDSEMEQLSTGLSDVVVYLPLLIVAFCYFMLPDVSLLYVAGPALRRRSCPCRYLFWRVLLCWSLLFHIVAGESSSSNHLSYHLQYQLSLLIVTHRYFSLLAGLFKQIPPFLYPGGRQCGDTRPEHLGKACDPKITWHVSCLVDGRPGQSSVACCFLMSFIGTVLWFFECAPCSLFGAVPRAHLRHCSADSYRVSLLIVTYCCLPGTHIASAAAQTICLLTRCPVCHQECGQFLPSTA